MITEKRPFPRVHKDSFMRGGGVHLECWAFGLSSIRSRYHCHSKKRPMKAQPIMRHAMISCVMLDDGH